MMFECLTEVVVLAVATAVAEAVAVAVASRREGSSTMWSVARSSSI